MADNENTFLNADNIYMDVEGEAGKSLDLELEQQTNLVGIIKDRYYSAEDKRRVDMTFGIGYGDDIKKAKTILTDLLHADERILKDPEPFVAVSSLGDSSVNFAVRGWVNTPDYWPVFFQMQEKVKLTFDEQGVSIPFPQRDIHLYNEK